MMQFLSNGKRHAEHVDKLQHITTVTIIVQHKQEKL